MKIIKEFKDYMTKDDILKSAGAFLIALTLRELILQFIKLVINPIFAIIFNVKDLTTFNFSFLGASIEIGSLIEALLNFIILSFTIFLIIKFSERTRLIQNNEKVEIKQMKKLNEKMQMQLDIANKQLELLNKLVPEIDVKKTDISDKNNVIENDTNIETDETIKSLSA